MQDRLVRTALLLKQVREVLAGDPKWGEHVEEIDFLIMEISTYLDGPVGPVEKEDEMRELQKLLTAGMNLLTVLLDIFW